MTETETETETVVGPASGPAPPPPPRALPAIPGYLKEAEVGRGGMGVVYHARQRMLNCTVALKMILASDHAGAEAGDVACFGVIARGQITGRSPPSPMGLLKG